MVGSGFINIYLRESKSSGEAALIHFAICDFNWFLSA
jgi:hypothetical protein